ncbi:MAG: OmpA family protein [Hymenobacteraceae bacterium]|nr:OmpA family protein [Hymenobacteraceae bacterium]
MTCPTYIFTKGLLRLLLVVLGGGLPVTVRAQGWVGISASNYAGTNALAVNPSSIADSRYRLYLNVVGGDVNLYNNYLKIDPPYGLLAVVRGKVASRYRDNQGRTIFRDTYLKEDLTGRNKFMTLSGEARLPTLQLALPHQQSVAFGSRVRLYIQASNVSENLTRINHFGLGQADDLGLANQLLKDSRFSANVNGWQEFDATYARVLTPNTTHFFKAGATVKYLVGLGGGYINNEGLGYVVYNSDSIQLRDRHVAYGYTDYRYYARANDFKIVNLYNKKRLGRGLGLDLGVTYEFRPDYQQYDYVMDGKTGLSDPEQNKYRLRLGLAVVDIGRIKYQHPQDVSSSQLTESAPVQLGSLDTLSYRNLDHVDALVAQLAGVERRTSSFKSSLPRTLNLTADYHLRRATYVGMLWSQSLLSRYTIGARTFSRVTLIPRFEKAKVEVALPISLADDYRRFGVGAMVRVGPAFVGSDNLGGVFGLGRVSGYDLYFGVAFALRHHKTPDRDHDGVSDAADQCPDVKGVWEFRGCPDRDGDHVPDTNDDCPDEPGRVEFRGCPDRDGDRIIDRDDACPDAAGPAEFQGCPDRDGDRVIDRNDACPDVAGVAEFKGCPDRDGDHVTDSEDRCPDTPGSVAHLGCPDTDADGVYDHEDQCVMVVGTVENHGCPYPDSDEDGVPDQTDNCPLTPGPVANQGCPVLTPIEVNIVRTAFANLEFAFRRAVIQPSSFSALDDLARLLEAKATYRLRLTGHTDNVGTTAANLTLSRQRAQAVRDYLVRQGIAPTRFVVEWFGPNQPIVSNQTAAGRERNRRVEMTVLID